MFYKGHIERVRMDVCELGKMDVILGMPWLAVSQASFGHNSTDTCMVPTV